MDGISDETSGQAETLTIEILGSHLRVRVTPEGREDVLRAADMLREHIDTVREASDPPDRAVARAALELSFAAITAKRQVSQALEDMLEHLERRIGT
jgi:cell division protein ZapA (FtsZ GTPase activity inhibitor)